tara:strand:- start:1386 stop:1859 length:474 start_codon:yes stop_codon:yes gene_type:complete
MYFPAPHILEIIGLQLSREILYTTHVTPEERLWRGVLLNAIEDVLIKHSDRKHSLQKGQAHDWIITNSVCFQKVCGWASLDSDLVLEAYIKALEEGKVTFTARQIMWNKYARFSKKIRSIEECNIKRKYKGEIKRFRTEVLEAPTTYVTTLFTSVVA